MRFDIITLFPESIEPYLESSIIGRAEKKKLIKTKVWQLRNFTKNPASGAGKRRKVDDRAYGGGPGMVISAEVVYNAVKKVTKGIRDKKSVAVIIFDAGGKQFDDKTAINLVKKHKRLILVAGHYEGIDERAEKMIKDAGFKVYKISIGPYVLTGGELPSLVLVDSISRRIPGVLGKAESLEESRFGTGLQSYTRPEVIKVAGKSYKVPKVLLSGHHKNIEEWREKKTNK